MNCIFCKNNTINSKSLEHILPESIGNRSHILPPGVVCDRCNNYIAREVEKPFLENDAIKLLRFEESIRSKKGKIPSAKGVLITDYTFMPISILRSLKSAESISNESIIIEIADGDAVCFQSMPERGKIIVPKFDMQLSLPSGSILSRFLGKVALEVFAFKFLEHTEWLDVIVSNTQLDNIRNHVRLGTNAVWPCSVRQIYDKNIPNRDSQTGELYQVMNEFDILITEHSEYYLVLVIFGIEFVINLGGPEIDGYHTWLNKYDQKSPLYVDWRNDIKI